MELINNNSPTENKIENNIPSNSNSSSKIKVGLKKFWNVSSFKSPEKSSVPPLISKINEENIHRVSSLYIKDKENIKQRKLTNRTS